ncbi:5076_t:CDS:2 [Funneliformis geosporum]|uniref:648_t:CDS:1 n=1 Tax=Funneliformis geosporum TaxID=1117311 RepID=A0A9W4WYZ3_9GLOM|nr:648_t:CDS:2 [Funneliformis geosporum]CAI2195349.1 5076_t:CDS:2 [Funneliformis geosporum]
MSGSTSSTTGSEKVIAICQEINRLGLALDLASNVLNTISVDNYNERLAYLKELLPASVENLADDFGKMSVSDSSATLLTNFMNSINGNSEIMKKNLEVMNKTSELLIRLDRNNNRLIPVQDYTGSMKRARAYRNISFEKVTQEYFLCKTKYILGEFARNKSVASHLRKPVPIDTEEKVQTWFDDLMEALPTFKKKLVVVDTHRRAYLDGYMPDFLKRIL